MHALGSSAVRTEHPTSFAQGAERVFLRLYDQADLDGGQSMTSLVAETRTNLAVFYVRKIKSSSAVFGSRTFALGV